MLDICIVLLQPTGHWGDGSLWFRGIAECRRVGKGRMARLFCPEERAGLSLVSPAIEVEHMRLRTFSDIDVDGPHDRQGNKQDERSVSVGHLLSVLASSNTVLSKVCVSGWTVRSQRGSVEDQRTPLLEGNRVSVLPMVQETRYMHELTLSWPTSGDVYRTGPRAPLSGTSVGGKAVVPHTIF